MPFRIRSILVTSDLSESAREVLRTGSAFAALTGAELHVVHATEGQGPPDAKGEDPVEVATRALREQLDQAMPRRAEVTSSRAHLGRADEVIRRRAKEVDADLIVLGPHRRRPEADRDLGTTADRIVRTSDEPCLIVRGPVSLPLRCVLIPSDLSDAGRGALDLGLIWAAALRQPTRAGERTRVDVLHVLPPSSEGDHAGRTLEDEVAAAGERTGCAALLSVERTLVEGDDPAGEILRRADEKRVDLVVLGTRGASGPSGDLIGSVSSAVARAAECAVLLVPPAWWKSRQTREQGIRPET